MRGERRCPARVPLPVAGRASPDDDYHERLATCCADTCGCPRPAGLCILGTLDPLTGSIGNGSDWRATHYNLLDRGLGKTGSDVPERHYIDPTFMPTPECYMLYGWLLSHQFQADAGVYERATTLPDPLDESL